MLEGNKLKINCTALPFPYHRETDGIRVAIVEAPDFKARETMWEKAVPGFSLQDCDRVVSDNVAHTVTWKGKADLSSLKGRAIYLRFQLKNAGLYSFQIAP